MVATEVLMPPRAAEPCQWRRKCKVEWPAAGMCAGPGCPLNLLSHRSSSAAPPLILRPTLPKTSQPMTEPPPHLPNRPLVKMT